MIEEGGKAPAMTVKTTGGEQIDLAKPGGPLVLYFYPKDRNGYERLDLRSCADDCLSAPSH